MLYARLLFGISVSLLSGLLMYANVSAASFESEAASSRQLSTLAEDLEWNTLAETAPNCRYGLSAWRSDFLAEMRVGWVQNFTAQQISALPANIEYVPVVHVNQDILANDAGITVERYPTYTTSPGLDELQRRLIEQPGQMWIIGNEIDREYHQDDTEAYVYATAYHDLYYFIKQHDPSAQVATSGLVGVTPGRLQYLDQVLESYRNQNGGRQMPVDVWTFHDYIFSEIRADGSPSYAGIALGTDPALAILDAENDDISLCPRDDVYCRSEHDSIDAFIGQVVAMRTWMADNGYQDKPLILTEVGLLFPYQVVNGECTLKDEFGNCFTPERAAEFMTNVYAYLESAKDGNIGYPLDDNRLVQQWMWFSMPYDGDSAVYLPSLPVTLDSSQLTVVGQTHIDLVNSQPLERNVFVERDSYTVAMYSNSGISAEINAVFRNNGNTAIDQPFTVTFYADEAKTEVIGTVTVPASIDGCARRSYSASTVWEGSFSLGWHPYWFTLDTDGVIDESNESDNAGRGWVFVADSNIYVPTIYR